MILLFFPILHEKVLRRANLKGNWILNVAKRNAQLAGLSHVTLFYFYTAAKG